MATRAQLFLLLITILCCKAHGQRIPPSSLPLQPAPSPAPHIGPKEWCAGFTWPLAVDDAVEFLRQSQVFSDSAVGYAGEPTPQVAAFNVIMDDPHALSHIDLLANTDRPIGRLYALCAYQVLDHDKHAALLETLLQDNRTVHTQFGCLGGTEPVRDVLTLIEGNDEGKRFRSAKEATYAAFSGTDNVCARAAGR